MVCQRLRHRSRSACCNVADAFWCSLPCNCGEFAAASGQDHCDKCPAGRASSVQAATVQHLATFRISRCAIARFGAGFQVCLQCKPGTFAGTAGLGSCQVRPQSSSIPTSSGVVARCVCTQACEAGTYALTNSSTACKSCVAGRFSARSAANCSVCTALVVVRLSRLTCVLCRPARVEVSPTPRARFVSSPDLPPYLIAMLCVC